MKSAQGVFCNNNWKAGAAILIIAGLALFVWGFHLYKYHGIIYGPDAIQPEAMNAIQQPVQNAGTTHGAVNISSGNVANAASNLLAQSKESLVKMSIQDNQGHIHQVGSGVIVSDHGHIMTALHLVKDHKVIKVSTQNRSYEAQLIKRVPEHNLAIFKLVSNENFQYSSLAPVTLQQGDHVYALGMGPGASVNPGNVLTKNNDLNINNQSYQNLIVTDAVDSWFYNGGPLLNSNGQLSGINMAVQDANGMVQGYTIPAQPIYQSFQDIVDFNTLANLKGVANELNLGVQKASKQVVGAANIEDFLHNLWERSKETTEQIYYLIEHGQWQDQNYFEQLFTSAHELSNDVARQLFQVYQVQGFQLAIETINDAQITFMGYTINSIMALTLLGFISGVSAGMVTMGGGIIKISGLMLFFGYGLTIIRPVAYITNIFVYGAAALRYRKNKLISWENVTPLIPFGIFGFVFGYLIGNELDNTTIRYLLGGFALWIFFKTVLEIFNGDKDEVEEESENEDEDTEKKPRKYHAWLGMPMGIVSGILGISGGVIETPLQRYFIKVPLKEAIANSAVLVFCTSSLGAIVAMVHGAGIGAFDIKTPIVLAALVIPGSFLGGIVGAWLTERVSVTVLKTIYAAIMLMIAIRMLFYFV